MGGVQAGQVVAPGEQSGFRLKWVRCLEEQRRASIQSIDQTATGSGEDLNDPR